jgi:hypothetical protein
MKLSLALLTLITTSAYAAPERPVYSVDIGAPCALEGERAYIQNGEDDDVYYCKDGKWAFLYKRMPNEDQD